MKFSTQMICNALIASAMLALPAMSANLTSTNVDGAGKAVANGQACSAGSSREGSRREGFSGHQKFARKLNLTDDQLEKLAVLKTEFRASIAPEKIEMQSLKSDIRLALMQPTVNKDQVMALQTKINADRDSISNKALSSRLDMINVFTPEQRTQIKHQMLVRTAFGGGHHEFRGARRAQG